MILGDSFAASTDTSSWASNLTGYKVANFSMSGAGEYKLIKKLNNVDIDSYDKHIVVHTSANRIYIENNPYYPEHASHSQCDLIYQDMHARLPDKFAENVVWWFEKVFDLEQAQFTHNLLIDYAVNKLPNAIHVSFFNIDHPKVHNLHYIWKNNPGTVNHLDSQGNKLVLEFLTKHL